MAGGKTIITQHQSQFCFNLLIVKQVVTDFFTWPPPPEREHRFRMELKQWGVLLFVAAVALLCYHNSVHCELVFDDHLAIETNPDVSTHDKSMFSRDGLFCHDFWGKDLRHEASHKVCTGNEEINKSSHTDPSLY